MTTPAAGYYENIIRSKPSYAFGYCRCVWRRFYSSKSIRSFTWLHRDEIFNYSKGTLTVRKNPPSPDWQVPESYLQTVAIPLSPRQEKHLRAALSRIHFPKLKTAARSYVNFKAGGMITEHFFCRLSPGFSFRYIGQNTCEDLEPLLQVLQQIAGNSAVYQEICHMSTWLFSEQRWNQLHPED